MKNKTLHIILLSLVAGFANAQYIEPSVIASAGTYATSASGSMSWTIGEVMTETYSSSSYFFTQGFNQPDTTAPTGVSNLTVENIVIYPNPVSTCLNINLAGAPGNHIVYIYDITGRILLNKNVRAGQYQLQISFVPYANGVYLLSIINTDLNTRTTYKINKID